MTIKNWTAKRSGSRMTITGVDEAGRPVKVSADNIMGAGAGGAKITAVDFKTDEVHILA